MERPDGSTSFYGDRDDWTTAATRPDGYVNSTAPGHTAKALSWWQTRFQDSTGNYIDFRYLNNPAGGAYPGESLISSVEYTGKKQLAAQTGGAWGPYAKIVFNYAALSTTQYVRGSVAGGTVWQTRQLSSITVIGDIASGQQARHYALAYSTSVSGSGARTLTSIRECRDSTQAVCLPQTSFAWAPILNGFYSTDMISNTAGFDGLASLRLGDVDGDGLTDVAWFSASGNSSQLQVSFGEINGSGQLSFNRVAQLPWIVARKPADIDKYWHLFDYDGDGRDDLFVAIPNGNWVLYPSSGRPTSAGVRAFNAGSNLIAALSPPISSTTTSTILADLNGDGLLDVMYRQPASGSTPSLLYTRLTERMGAGFEWGAQRSVGMATDLDPPQVLLNEFTNLLDPDQRVHLFDFNGDSRSDLAISTGITWYKNDNSSECSNPIPRPAQPIAEWTDEAGQSWREWPAQVPQDAVDLASNRCTVLTRFVELYGVTSIQPTHVQMSVIKRWHRGGELWSGFPQPPPPTGSTFKFADFNGDGLTDALVKSGSWSVDLTGIGVVQTGLPAFPNEDYLQLTDVNGDGRADIVYPQSANSNYRPFVGHFARPDGTFPTYASPLPGGYARGCKNTTCDLTRTHFLFGDFDGDAATDFFALYDNTSEYYSSRPPSNHRFVPRDVIGKITDGVGAVTELSYRPLTLADVYRRGTGTRAVSWGRGSPVQDVFGPQYVVIRAQSSAPVYGNPNALSAIYYRYSGARIQAGGGGHLGFEQVQSFDTTPGNAHIVSTTTYRQDAPFIGMPQTTERRVVNGAYVPPSCLTGWVTNACFQRLAPPFPWIAGTRVALSTNSWESSPGYWSGSQTPVHVRMAGSQEDVYALESGALTSQVLSAFSYQGYGFAGTTSVDTYGAGGSLVARVQTNNVYDHYTTPWRLGRLRYSTVTHTRNGVSTSRRTDYTYDIGAAFTGLLTSEQVQSNGGVSQNLRTFHTLDAFGNRTHTYTCSSHLTEAACKSTAVTFQPTSLEYIHRYARTQYDSRGRYPVASYSPFWNGSGTSEYLDSQVLNRNLFGDVTHARDANAINTTAIYGQLGRLYQRATDTGVPVQTTWRTCSQVACPPGAVTRQQTTASGAPTQWSYHDVLGRVVLAVSQTRHLGTVNKGFSGVCTAYDAAGRPSRVSEPFFLASAASAVEPPSFASNTCTARYWNLTHYDALGRVTQVVRADGTGTSVSRSGLTTTTWDPNGNATSQTVNALGEVVTSTDAAGLSLTFTYAPDGQIAKVSRNAGRGDVETTFQYDPLGRKTSQTDRDTGTTTFAYNALGELIRQTDAMNYRVDRWLDARGRLWRQQAYAGASLESTAQFVFDTLKRGLPSSESISGSAGSQSRSYGYDGLARPIRRDSTMDGRTYREETRYDSYGRAWKTRDASGGWLKQQFDVRGFATRLCDSTEADTAPSCGTAFHATVDEVDARGAVLVERRGSSVGPTIARSYNALNGQLTGVCTGSGCTVQNSAYGYDNKGQLTSREEAGRYKERFQYDGADRLTLGWFEYLGTTWYSANAPYVNPDAAAPANLSFYAQYDKLGNICRKYQFGLFAQYGYAGRAGCGTAGNPGSGSASSTLSAHQTQSLFIPGLITIANQHDARGNMTSADSLRFYAYNALNQATEVRRVASVGSSDITIRARFAYGVDGARYRRIDDGSSAGGTTTTTIIGAVERVQKPGGAIQWRRTVGGVAIVSYSGDQLVGGITQAAGAGTVRHQFTDRLGSVQVIGLVNGSSVTVQERLDSGADGQWRTPNPPFGQAGSSHTPRGFTGHEHLEGHDTIHMNGRLYWPTGGRMVQADPIITDIYNPQNWNPYSYVLNNPLNLTDPSGYSFLDTLLNPLRSAQRSLMRALGRDVSGALIAACSAIPAGWSIACAAGASYDHARAFGASSSDARRSGVAGAFSAAVATIVKYRGSGLSTTSRVLIAATSGGITSVIQGGKFGHGFVSAGVTARASPYVSSNIAVGTAASAIIGGTVSEMTGGKFANGARSGAFAYVVGKAMQRASSGAARDAGTKTSEDNPRVGLLAAEEARAALYDAGVLSKIYKGDFKVASEDWARLVDPIARKYNVEISSLLYQIGENLFVYAAPYSDGNSSQVIVRAGPRLPEQYGGKIIGYIHTHPSSAALSSDDRSIAWDMRESAGHTVYAISVYRGAPGTVWDTFNRRDILWKDF